MSRHVQRPFQLHYQAILLIRSDTIEVFKITFPNTDNLGVNYYKTRQIPVFYRKTNKGSSDSQREPVPYEDYVTTQCLIIINVATLLSSWYKHDS